jgi:hypothetical protein
MSDHPPPKTHEEYEHSKWAFEMNREHAQKEHDRINDFANYTNKAAIDSGHLALRTAVLVNGGAAVSVLAFIGGLVGQGKVALGPQFSALTFTLLWFAIGVASAMLGIGFAYFTNFSIAAEASTRERKWEHPYVSATKISKRWRCIGNVLRLVAVILGLASAALFVVGMLAVRSAITQLS